VATVATPDRPATPTPLDSEVRGWRVWWLAARPRTLPVAFAPVLVGTALAAAEGAARPLPALAALLGALLLQIGANFANDLFDSEKGADGEDRIGPPRAMQLGLATAGQMRRAIAAAFGGALLVGVYLVAIGGWPIAAIGVISIAAGLAYTGGPFAFGYHGLGDLAVFLFFGPVAVAGTHYVQASAPSGLAIAASLPVGALAAAILVVNNLRDIETDAKAGKRTLAVRIGRRKTRIEYVGLLVVAYALLPDFWLLGPASPWVMLPLLTLPRALVLTSQIIESTDGPALNAALAGTAQLAFGFSMLFAIGWLL
jgi:1,4-dihydroxy-2-naphthoate octaprenyltransferase